MLLQRFPGVPGTGGLPGAPAAAAVTTAATAARSAKAAAVTTVAASSAVRMIVSARAVGSPAGLVAGSSRSSSALLTIALKALIT